MRVISNRELELLTHQARDTPRLRRNLNIHQELSNPVQRLYNAMEPGTYVRPHRHPEPGKWELFMAPKGAIAALLFDDTGTVTHRLEIGAGRQIACVEVPANTWHSIIALEPASIMFEIKPGPYNPLTDKVFAPWAPPEGHERAAQFEIWARGASEGDRAPSV